MPQYRVRMAALAVTTVMTHQRTATCDLPCAAAAFSGKTTLGETLMAESIRIPAPLGTWDSTPPPS